RFVLVLALELVRSRPNTEHRTPNICRYADTDDATTFNTRRRIPTIPGASDAFITRLVSRIVTNCVAGLQRIIVPVKPVCPKVELSKRSPRGSIALGGANHPIECPPISA